MTTRITTHDINRRLENVNFITLYNIKITCLNLDIIGRHNFNKDGDSFIRIEQLNTDSDDIINNEIISFHFPYICGFGHCLYSMLSCYSQYLNFYKSQLTKPFSILHFANNDHISQLNKLYAQMESANIVTLTIGKIIKVRQLTFFKPCWTPLPQCNIATQTIKNYIQQYFYPNISQNKQKHKHNKIAICKTSNVKQLDNKFNPHGNLDYYKLQPLLNEFDIELLNHAQMSVIEIITALMSCKLLVTNWGATSAWHAFLSSDQKCYCLVPKSYWGEINSKKWLCFNNDFFPNYIISSRPIDNNLYTHNIAHIKTELGKLTLCFIHGNW